MKENGKRKTMIKGTNSKDVTHEKKEKGKWKIREKQNEEKWILRKGKTIHYDEKGKIKRRKCESKGEYETKGR